MSTNNPELDAYFERLLKAIASMRSPDVHVHVHTAEPRRKKSPIVQAVEEVNPSPVPYTG